MASQLLGQNLIGPYDESTNDFDSYLERLEYFFQANDIEDDKKVSSFLTIIGDVLFKKLKGLIHPKKFKDFTFKQLTDVMKKHYKPKVIDIYERFQLRKRTQKEGESISDFVSSLKTLASSCNYSEEVLKVNLLETFVVGLRDESTQSKLLSMDDLTFDEAVKTAAAREVAAREAHEMSQRQSQNVGHISSVKSKSYSQKKKVSKSFGSSNAPTGASMQSTPKVTNSGLRSSQATSTSVNPCFGCGARHNRSECPFKGATCFLCKKVGHIQKVCHARTRQSRTFPNTASSTNMVTVDNTNSDSPYIPQIPAEYIYHTEAVEPIIVPL